MGCGASLSEEGKKMQSMSRMIDKEINREERENNNTIKALLIGTGASGKSTICKQMRLLFLNGYSKKDAMAFREPIVLNLMRNMITLCEMAGKWGYAFTEPNQPTYQQLLGMQLGVGVELDVEMGEVRLLISLFIVVCILRFYYSSLLFYSILFFSSFSFLVGAEAAVGRSSDQTGAAAGE
jgi:hypothetical protein